MRVVVQRVSEARVEVDGEVVGAIGAGLCLLVGVGHHDDADTAARLAEKVFRLRVLDDPDGRMGVALADVQAPEALVVSQFTLLGDTTRGRRPGWSAAAPGPVAEPVVAAVADGLARLGCRVATGRFGADMAVHLVNDGPVTLVVDL